MSKKLNNVAVLLDGSNVSLYWLGFLSADGCFSRDAGRVSLEISSKDYEHLQKYNNHIQNTGITSHRDRHHEYICGNISNGTFSFICSSVVDPIAVPMIMEKYDLKERKTYNPPDFTKMNFSDDGFISFLVGFADGDGYIGKLKGRKCAYLSIRCHYIWGNFLQQSATMLAKITGTIVADVRIRKARNPEHSVLSDFNINSGNLRFLKQKAIEFGLPILSRKWDKVDLSFIGKREIANQRIERTKQLLSLGFCQRKIAQTIGVSDASISIMIKNHPDIFDSLSLQGES